MSQESPDNDFKPGELEKLREMIAEVIEAIKQGILKEEIRIVENIVIRKLPNLSDDEKDTVRTALYSRMKPERERFIADITEEFLVKIPAATVGEITPSLIRRKDEHIQRIIRLVDAVYSEFKS